jgi:hypothetical protein
MYCHGYVSLSLSVAYIYLVTWDEGEYFPNDVYSSTFASLKEAKENKRNKKFWGKIMSHTFLKVPQIWVVS